MLVTPKDPRDCDHSTIDSRRSGSVDRDLGVLVEEVDAGAAVGAEAGLSADRRLDRARDLGMLLQIGLGVFAPLADPLAVVGEPRAGFLDHARPAAEVQELAGLGDALAVHDVRSEEHTSELQSP